VHLDTAFFLRGGGGDGNFKKSTKTKEKTTNKRKKKSRKFKEKADDDSKTKTKNKTIVQQAFDASDPAQALGDAIRQRADELTRGRPQGIEEDTSSSILSLTQQQVAASLSSLQWGLGASDYRVMSQTSSAVVNEELVAPTAVIAQYFLQSHGGAHALQTLCSLLATAAGVGALGVSMAFSRRHSQDFAAAARRQGLGLRLSRRTCLFAMIQHVAGLVAAAWLAAKMIPEIGLAQARTHVEALVRDPVAQYVFYTASVIVWLPTNNNAGGGAATTPISCWWMTLGSSLPRLVPLLLVGPVLLREIVSLAMVISDVLILSMLGNNSSDGGATRYVQSFLGMSQTIVNALMSVLVTPSVWKAANAQQRQAILAKLVSKTSLVLEVAVGLLMSVDAAWSLVEFLFLSGGASSSSSQRLGLLSVGKRLLVAHLYLSFLWTRRRTVTRLATHLRGGASQVPLYVLNVLLHPRAHMGLSGEDDRNVRNSPLVDGYEDLMPPEDKERPTWKYLLGVALAVDE
jgi:hypothetical protein